MDRALLLLVVVAKVGVAWALVRLIRLEVRPLQLAVGLGQIAEFSFVPKPPSAGVPGTAEAASG